MKYTVVSTPFADLKLAEIWLEADKPQEVTEASDRINAMLRNDPDQLGAELSDNRRVIVLPPPSGGF